MKNLIIAALVIFGVWFVFFRSKAVAAPVAPIAPAPVPPAPFVHKKPRLGGVPRLIITPTTQSGSIPAE